MPRIENQIHRVEHDDKVRYVLFVNNNEDEPVPPFGAMTIVDIDGGIFYIDKPDTDNATDVMWNGPCFVPPGKQGQGARTYPIKAAYTTAHFESEPSPGEIWGIKASSWFLTRNYTGFKILSVGADATVNISLMTQTFEIFIKITSTTKVNGRYPAIEQYRDVLNQVWIDGPECWYEDANE